MIQNPDIIKMEALTPEIIRDIILDPLISDKNHTAHTSLKRFKQLGKFAYQRKYTETNLLDRLTNDFHTPNKCTSYICKEEMAKK